jgi:hypothetical protein
MGGWRDTEGRTAAERHKQANDASRARFLDTVRNRPASLVKPMLTALFVGVLIVALLGWLR